MRVEFLGYNISKWFVDAPITSETKTEIGTEKDYKVMKSNVSASGLFMVDAKIDGVAMKGTCVVNEANDEFIDFGTVTNYGGYASAITGTITNESGKMYVTLKMTTI